MSVNLNFNLKPKNKTLYLSESYASNGHWLMTRSYFKRFLPKQYAKIEHWSNGRYYYGDKSNVEIDDKYLSKIIPKYDESAYTLHLGTIKEVMIKESTRELIGFKGYFNDSEGLLVHIGINVDYYDLLTNCEELRVTSPNNPIVGYVAGEIAVVLMPMRL